VEIIYQKLISLSKEDILLREENCKESDFNEIFLLLVRNFNREMKFFREDLEINCKREKIEGIKIIKRSNKIIKRK